MFVGFDQAAGSPVKLGKVGVLLTALLARTQAEERLLRTQFGAEFNAYCARTSRLIPGLY